MPAVSKAQAALMRAASHGATFKKARKLRQQMTPEQLNDFSRVDPDVESYSYNSNSRNNLKRGAY